jgi:type II secretory pathway pseudopilin PulG
MKVNGRQGGFTIIETMIVLAVTSALFIMVAVTIAGRQNETSFQQAVNNITSSIQQTIDQVASGDYANTNNFSCDGTSGTLDISIAAANQQGSNNGCIFLGKVLQFGVSGTSPEQYKTYTIAGLQNNNGDLAQTAAVAVAPCQSDIFPTAPNCTGYPDASTSGILNGGLTVACMKYFTTPPAAPVVPSDPCTAGGTAIGAFAIASSLGSYSGGDLVSGSQQQNIIPISPSALNKTAKAIVQAIDKHLYSSGALASPASVVAICFVSGGTNQSGLVTVGGSGRSLSVTLAVRGGKIC